MQAGNEFKSPKNRYVASIHAHTLESIEQKLNDAVAAAQAWAMKQGRYGVKVTRHEPTRFTVSVTPEIEYGRTQEVDEFRP